MNVLDDVIQRKVATKYKDQVDELNDDNVKFPVMQDQYNKIENRNAINLDVFGYKEKQTF